MIKINPAAFREIPSFRLDRVLNDCSRDFSVVAFLQWNVFLIFVNIRDAQAFSILKRRALHLIRRKSAAPQEILSELNVIHLRILLSC